VKEGDTAHSFTGDAVLLNDRLVVVLRKGGAGAQVYAKTPGGLKPRADLVPCPSGADDVPALSSLKIAENKTSAVKLEAAFKTNSGADCSSAFRLATGDVLLEARAGAGTSRLALRGSIQYVVIPDYFGDDMVFGADTADAARVGLPAENFFLSLVEGGDSIVMCVWPSGERNADLVLTGAGGQRAIKGCEVECREGESMWAAFLEGADIWHSEAVPAGNQQENVELKWRPPFPAKWRADIVGRDGVCKSWAIVDQQERERQLKQGASSSGPAESVCPCWFDSAGAYVLAPAAGGGASSGLPGPDQVLVVAYPVDRDRATPLTVFCPVDVMRNALGVGPCQYILEVEGFAKGEAATPAEVTRWVEKQFEKKKDVQESAAIRGRLEEMMRHIADAQARVEQYDAFARQVQALCKSQGQDTAADTARSLQRIAEDMAQTIAQKRAAMKTPAQAKSLADMMAAAIGQKRPLSEVQGCGEQLRRIGAAQDNVLSKCRLAVRRLKQECRMAAGARPSAADLVATVREGAEKLLHKR
jgi:hypothetical protein